MINITPENDDIERIRRLYSGLMDKTKKKEGVTIHIHVCMVMHIHANIQ